MSTQWDRLARLTAAGLDRAKALRDKTRELRDDIREDLNDERERALVAPLVPGQTVHRVGLASIRLSELHRSGRQLGDVMAREFKESLDPRVLFGLLNIVNPVLWVEAVIWPVRWAAGAAMLPVQAATAITQGPSAGTTESAAGTTDERPGERKPGKDRVWLPLTPEQEAFRAMFRLSGYRPLAEQLAEIAYKWRYVFSGELASRAGSLLLFVARYTGTPLAVTDSHLHLLQMGPRPEGDKPDRRKPRLLWSVEWRHITRIDVNHGVARFGYLPMTITFDDGSWIRVSTPGIAVEQRGFYAALRHIPGKRPRL